MGAASAGLSTLGCMTAADTENRRTVPAVADHAPPAGRDRAALALDVVVVFAVVLATLRLVELFFYLGELATWAVVLRISCYGAALLASILLWLWWRVASRRPEPDRRLGPAAIAFTALTGSLFVSGDQGLALPLFVVGLIMLLRTYRLRTGMIAVAVFVGVQAVIFVALARDWLTILEQAVSSAFLFGFGLLIAWLFAEVDRQRRDNAALATEVQRRSETDAELASMRERQRTARDLHDGIGHEVTVIMMSLQFAERMAERDPERAWEEVSRAREQAASALQDIRTLARALHPPGLSDGGAADLAALAGSFRGTGLTVAVQDEAAGEVLGDDLAVFRRRFVQEALTNVVRHSSARRVVLRQQVRDGSLVITVTDDGGPVNRIEPGFGLRSLAERADQLGGVTVVRSGAAGLEVEAVLPLGAAA